MLYFMRLSNVDKKNGGGSATTYRITEKDYATLRKNYTNQEIKKHD